MTRAERAAEKVRLEKQKLADDQREAKTREIAQRKAIAQAEAEVRAEQRKATNKRRYHVGALADDAGLFAWSDSELAAVFAVLADLRSAPDPAQLREQFLAQVKGRVAAGVP